MFNHLLTDSRDAIVLPVRSGRRMTEKRGRAKVPNLRGILGESHNISHHYFFVRTLMYFFAGFAFALRPVSLLDSPNDLEDAPSDDFEKRAFVAI